MLDSLRKASKSWLAKGLLLLLLVSFGVWGVSGRFLNDGGVDPVVTAGDTKVSALDYRLAFDRQVAIYSRQLGQRISREQAQAFGIDQAVLGQIVAGAVLDEQSRMMSLGLSKDRLAALVADDPAFKGVNGQFSRENFRLVLRNIGMSEDDYIRNREDVAIRQQIVEAVSDGVALPQTLLDALAKHTGEARDVEYFVVGEKDIEPVSAPDDAELQAFFDTNKSDYSAPEYRKINYVRLTPEAIINEEGVSEDDIRADYEARKNNYTTPETRRIEQLVFPDDDSAAAAHQRLLAGQTFEEAVAEAGKKMTDVDLGTVDKTGLPDNAIADAAFSLKNPGDVSDVVEGAFGPVILRVTAINPAEVQPLSAVHDEIRHQLALVTANDTLLDIHDAYEDARAGGASMREAATSQKLKMETIGAVDSNGLTPSGEKLSTIPEQSDLISASFETEKDVENQPINAAHTGFIWYEVADITPAHDRSLDDVRDKVIQDWTAEETASRISQKAKELAERISNGETLEAVAEAGGFTVQHKYGLKRGATDVDIGSRGIAEIFDGGPQHDGAVSAPSGNGHLVFKVTNVSQPIGGTDNLDAAIRDNVRKGLADDLLDQMVAKLQSVFPVRVNQSAIQRALSL